MEPCLSRPVVRVFAAIHIMLVVLCKTEPVLRADGFLRRHDERQGNTRQFEFSRRDGFRTLHIKIWHPCSSADIEAILTRKCHHGDKPAR